MRLQAVERFEGGQKNREIAVALRVSERSVERWSGGAGIGVSAAGLGSYRRARRGDQGSVAFR